MQPLILKRKTPDHRESQRENHAHSCVTAGGPNSHFQIKAPCHFVNQSMKTASHIVHSKSELKHEKQKNSVHFAVRGKLCWGYFANRTARYPDLSTDNTKFVAPAVCMMNQPG